MSPVRVSVWLSYLMVALAIVASVLQISERMHDPIWAQMPESRRNYDIIAIFVLTFGVIVAYGLLRRREWGRVLAISFACIVLFMYVGTRILAPVLTSGAVPIRLGWDAAIMGTLSIASILTLWRHSFRER